MTEAIELVLGRIRPVCFFIFLECWLGVDDRSILVCKRSAITAGWAISTDLPQTLGLQDDDIQRLVTFPGSGGIVITKPTVKGVGEAPPVAGLPQPATPASSRSTAIALSPSNPDLTVPIKYQQVHHLNPSNIASFDTLTYPSLQNRWRDNPPQGELLGISAAAGEVMVGFAVAELLPEGAELISLLVLPPYRQQGIGTRLVGYLERTLSKQGCRQLLVRYQSTALSTAAFEAILKKFGWSTPEPSWQCSKKIPKHYL